MVTPGSFHVWSLSRVSNIPNYIMYMSILTCIYTLSHRLMNTQAGGIAPFATSWKQAASTHRHSGLKSASLCLENTCFHQNSANN